MLRVKLCLKLLIVQFDYAMLKAMECLKPTMLKAKKWLKVTKMLEAMKRLKVRNFANNNLYKQCTFINIGFQLKG